MIDFTALTAPSRSRSTFRSRTRTGSTSRPESRSRPDAPPRPRHRLRLAFALLLVAPLVGEFVLGNQPVTALPGLIVLAPLYGSGALLIREAARRSGRGWPTMILLAAAYALVEEGPVDQMLWNPHYGGTDMGLAYAGTAVPWLGTSVALVQEVLAMHTIWSICVPIALVEAFSPGPARPWLGRPGLVVTTALFGLAAFFLGADQHTRTRFMASPGHFAGAGVVIAGLIAAAFAFGRRARPPLAPEEPSSRGARQARQAPRPRTVGVVAFAAASLYWAMDVVLPESASPWIPVAVWCLLAAGTSWACARWSHRPGWGDRHRLALAGGALLTYVWLGFVHAEQMGIPPVLALLGNVLFGTGAVVLLVTALRRRPPHIPAAHVEAAPVASRPVKSDGAPPPGRGILGRTGYRTRTGPRERRRHGVRIGERPP